MSIAITFIFGERLLGPTVCGQSNTRRLIPTTWLQRKHWEEPYKMYRL